MIRDDLEIKFEEAFKADFYKVRYYANSFLNDTEMAQNITQDVFYQLWKNREKVNFDESTMPYLLTIAKNMCLNYLRRDKINSRYIEFKQEYTMEMFNADSLESEPTSILYSKEVQELFKKGIESMPDFVRETFLLSRTNDLTYKEIAEKLNVSQKTVEGRITRALKVLRDIFKDYLPILAGYFIFCMFIK